MAEISGLNIVVVDPFLDTNVQAAINKAAAAPGATVWIPNSYTGTDAVPANTSGIAVFDMRSAGNWAGGNKVVTATAAAALTAAAGGTFATTLNLPGSNRYNGRPFRVRASGWCALSGGTYTASIQPQMWASAVSGYTASAAAAIFTFAAVNATIAVAAAATLTYFPWEIECLIEGDNTSAIITGRVNGSINNNGTVLSTPATGANATWNALQHPATVGTLNMNATVPIQFLAGCINTGAFDGGANPTNTLTSFAILDA